MKYIKIRHILEDKIIKSVTFSDIEYNMRKRTAKREAFLNVMEKIIPWDEWVAYIAPHYPKG